MKYHFKVHQEDSRFWAECLELEGCLTQADSLTELNLNAADALNLFLDEPETSKVIFPLPSKEYEQKKDVIIVEADPQIAFSMLLRQTRISRGITQKDAAKQLGIDNLYSYQRLEHRANPTLKTIGRIKAIFPEFPLEYVF